MVIMFYILFVTVSSDLTVVIHFVLVNCHTCCILACMFLY